MGYGHVAEAATSLHMAYEYFSAMAFLSASIIARVDILAASMSMDINVSADSAKGTIMPAFTDDA